MEINNNGYTNTAPSNDTIAPMKMMGVNMSPLNNGQRSQKHAQRQEKAKNYNHILKTLSSGKNLNYQNEANTFLSTYFENLVAGNLDVIKGELYFGRSMLTFTQITQEGVTSQEFQGAEAIIAHLNIMKSHVNYNITQTIIQPALGLGSTILLIGSLNEFKMVISINLVKISKQLHILNQIFTIS